MPREQDSPPPSGAVGRETVEAVEGLVSLWFSAVADVKPRLSPRQVRALRAVRCRPELNVTALAGYLRVGLPTASRLCDRLEAAGLLRRCVQPDNRREVRLETTAQGDRFLAELTRVLSVRLAAAFDGVAAPQRIRLEGVLRSLDHGGFDRA
ncbi:MarR family transcriptional regulator [Streptomyces sp. NPDC046859]|uniref:MarR family winged helix-turn-helix transcriptional regulator n=1 Tax=Streptomyces sp. NPDC046859 TaxID=3155734 RepID=UPI0033C98169